MSKHCYIQRDTGGIVQERLRADLVVEFLYSRARERSPALFRMLTGARASSLIGFLYFDAPVSSRILGRRFVDSRRIDLSECVQPARSLDTARKLFERRIRYWECRPMRDAVSDVVAPADSRALLGSLAATSQLFVKGKFFTDTELFGASQSWVPAFRDADFVIFRLTPEKYHYTHTSVAGVLRDRYDVDGGHHSCNPWAVVGLMTPFSKNRRKVSILDTDVAGGTGVGLVAQIEVVALGVGALQECYSRTGYEDPKPPRIGQFLKKGVPLSLFRPGSSTVILLLQKGRVQFCGDLIRNRLNSMVSSRFSWWSGRPIVETDVQVRSTIASRATNRSSGAIQEGRRC